MAGVQKSVKDPSPKLFSMLTETLEQSFHVFITWERTERERERERERVGRERERGRGDLPRFLPDG